MLTDRELLTRRTQHEAKLERLEKWLRQLGKSKTPAAAYSRQFLTAERDKTLAAFARADAAMPALEAARLADQAAADALNAHNAQPAATSVDGELQVLAVRNILSRRVNEASAALEAARQAAALPSFQDLIQYAYAAETDTDDLTKKARQITRYELGYTNPVSDMVVLQAKAASLEMLPFYGVAEATHRGDAVLAPLFAERWRIASARHGIGQEPAPSPSNYEIARDAARAAAE